MPSLEFVDAVEANPSTNASTSLEVKDSGYNTKLFETPLESIHTEARKTKKQFANAKYHTVSPRILSKLGDHAWCRGPKNNDEFKFFVYVIDLQKSRFDYKLRNLGKVILGHLAKMNGLYRVSFDDDDDVWGRFLQKVQKTSVNI